MYWCKLAATEKEYADIAALNYETFVEEIPQHEPNEEKYKVDRFHNENRYLIVYKERELVGMVAFRDQRPFSLDEKIGRIERLLSPELCGKLCEIRLLAVKKRHRTGRVFIRLIQAVYTYAYHQGYTAAVISGTDREEKLYRGMGFEPFHAPVGKEEATFIPMVLTRKVFEEKLEKRIAKGEQYTFYPGPVKQERAISHTDVSHRSPEFRQLDAKLKERLRELSDAKMAAVIVGTGTLANEVMLGQLKADGKRGLILTNGEFGERLAAQAERWNVCFEALRFGWGEAYDLLEIERRLKTRKYGWVLFVHGETSTGMLNPLEPLVEMTKRFGVKLCADCISSFGALPFSMRELYLATSVSGKAIGAIGGLAFVFSQERAEASGLPAYLDLEKYQDENPPFTVPVFLAANAAEAMESYPERYEVLAERYRRLAELPFVKETVLKVESYPMIATLKLPDELASLHEDARLNGLALHAESSYLRSRKLVQLSVIQPDFDEAIERFKEFAGHYLAVAGRQAGMENERGGLRDEAASYQAEGFQYR